jgi:hypothetical protein
MEGLGGVFFKNMPPGMRKFNGDTDFEAEKPPQPDTNNNAGRIANRAHFQFTLTPAV